MLRFENKVEEWDKIVKHMPELPFRCVNVLGQGVNCSVHTITPVEEESEETEESEEACDYFGLDDVQSVDGSETETGSDDESYSSEWSAVEADGESEVTHTCMTTPSPMGPVEVVAKKFLNVDEDTCYIAKKRGVHARVFLEDSARKYLEWLVEQTDRIDTSIVSHHISPTKACYSEFVSESLCHILLTDLVVNAITPHVVMAFRSIQHEHTGYLIQERISSTIDEALEENPKLTCRDMCAMYLQIFITLHVLQDSCGFKHHDLHLDNVFVKRIDDSVTWNGVSLKTATHFSYELSDGVVLTIPNCGYIVKIGDFGMSSLNIYGRRVQRLSMDTYKSSARWGDWDVKLEGKRGYDGQVLLGDIPFDSESWRYKDQDTHTFMKRLRAAAQGPNGKLTYGKQRPVVGHVSDVPPLDVVHQVFITDPLPVCDFRSTPPDSTVVCLTSLSNLSTSEVAKAPKKRRRRTHIV